MRETGVAAGDLVVDVGAGTGVLTRALAASGARVIALERDAALAEGLRTRFAASPAVSVLRTDALDWQLPAEPFLVVANLPFTASGAIVQRLVRSDLERAHLIVQWGFAQKHAAVWPATLKGTFWRAFYEVAIVRRLDRTAFTPPPNVDAAVVRFVRRENPLVPFERREHYWRFLSTAFRSQLLVRGVGLLHPLEVKRLAPRLGFAPNARPRDLDARQWASLYSAV